MNLVCSDSGLQCPSKHNRIFLLDSKCSSN